MSIPAGFKIVEQGGIPDGFKVVEPTVNATDGMSTGEKFLAGMGRGAVEIGQGAKQLGLRAMDALGLKTPEDVAEYDRKVAQDKRFYEQDLGQTAAGQVGAVAGNLAATAVPGGLVAKGAQAVPLVARAGARAASSIPGIVRAAGQGAVTGGTSAALLPSTGEDFWADKRQQAATGALIGGAAGGGLNMAGTALENVMPNNIAARTLNHFNRTGDFAEEGADIVRRTGIELSPAAQSGSKAMTFAENAARQSVFSADEAFRYDQKIAKQALSYVNQTLDNISPSGASAESAGEAIRGTVRNAVRDIAKQRDQVAAREYGAIRDLVAGKPVLQPTRLQEALTDIVQEFDGVQASDAAKVARWAKTALKDIDANQDIAKAIQNRRFWSNASKGYGNLFKDVSPGLQRRIASRVTRAIEDDLDTAADALGGDVGGMLKQANANYRAAMESIEYVEKSPLGRLMGQEFTDALDTGNVFNSVAPEKVMQGITRLHPSEIKVVRGILEDQSPETWQVVKRRYIEQALEEATTPPASTAQPLEMSGNKFVSALTRRKVDNDRMKAMFTETEISDLHYGIEALKRWGDRAGLNPSGTGPMNQFLNWVSGGSLSARATASIGSEAFALRQVAKAMNDPSTRKHVIELGRFPAWLEPPREKAAQLAAIVATKELDEENGSGPNGNSPTGY